MSERFLFGRDSAGNAGFKLSKAGFDASNTADVNLQIGGNLDTPQLVTSGTLSLISKKVEKIGRAHV